jgi:hypothetical protein
LLRQKKKAKKGDREAAALRVPVYANQKMGSERNSPLAQTAFTSFSIFCFAPTAASQRNNLSSCAPSALPILPMENYFLLRYLIS